MSLRLDPDVVFDSASRGADLAGRSVRGGISTLSGQLGRIGIQLLGTVVLARLLTPSDFGLVAMVTVVVALAEVIKSGGLSIATIQKDHITPEQISALFWVNVSLSTLVAAVVFAASPLVAAFYKESRLTWVTAAITASFLLSGISVQHEALLRRHMRFTAIALAHVAAQAVNVGVAAGAALLGARYWSLVAGMLAASLVSSAVVFWFCPWRPSRPRRGSGAGSMVRFGGHVLAFNIMDYFASNADYLLIGRYIGAGPLGLYTRAYSLFRLPVSQIRVPLAAVALPALSALKDQPARYAAYYRQFVGVLALLAVPMSVYCVIEAEFIIGALLGEQWMDAVPVFRWLAVAGVVHAVSTTRGLILISYGLSRRYVYLGASNTVVRVGAVLAGLPFGIEGVAAASAVAIVLFMPPSVWFFTRNTPVGQADFYRALARPVLFSAVAGSLVFLVQWLLPERVVWHVVVLCMYASIYLGLSYASASVRKDVARVITAWRSKSYAGIGGKTD